MGVSSLQVESGTRAPTTHGSPHLLVRCFVMASRRWVRASARNWQSQQGAAREQRTLDATITKASVISNCKNNECMFPPAFGYTAVPVRLVNDSVGGSLVVCAGASPPHRTLSPYPKIVFQHSSWSLHCQFSGSFFIVAQPPTV
jgi:hypothetical protein